jgi:hypothetical protein
MSERLDGYFYVEKLTPKGKEIYQVSHEVWSQNTAFEYFENEVDKSPDMPDGKNVIELYDGGKLIARRTF